MDYPNSKKAKKIFLVLYVGGGGGGQQQVPEGLDGEEREDGKARFERRREKDHERRKGGKKKGIKDKDWILKKKEVSLHKLFGFGILQWLIHLHEAISTTWKGGCPPRFKIHW